MTLEAVITAVCHVGLKRERNEDFAVLGEHCPDEAVELAEPVAIRCPIDQPTIIAAIDGLGGHAGGDNASNYVGGFLHANRRRAVDSAAVVNLLQEANASLHELTTSPDFAWMQGAGATIAGLALWGEQMTWFNVGDSRLYAADAGYVSQLSIDDSLAGPEGGSVTSVVLQCLGGTEELRAIEPHVGSRRLHAGDRYLACTDGLTDLVSGDTIELAMAQSASAAVRGLLRLALEAGGRDNITVVLVDIEFVDGA